MSTDLVLDALEMGTWQRSSQVRSLDEQRAVAGALRYASGCSLARTSWATLKAAFASGTPQ